MSGVTPLVPSFGAGVYLDVGVDIQAQGATPPVVDPTPPALDPGLYVNGGTLGDWSESRSKSTLSVFNDGVMAVMDTTSPCGPALKVEGLTAGNQYNFKFKFEQDTGSGYSLLRFYATAGLNSGGFGDVGGLDTAYIDETLTATNSTMYIGALRISHPVGGFIKLSEISIEAV